MDDMAPTGWKSGYLVKKNVGLVMKGLLILGVVHLIELECFGWKEQIEYLLMKNQNVCNINLQH